MTHLTEEAFTAPQTSKLRVPTVTKDRAAFREEFTCRLWESQIPLVALESSVAMALDTSLVFRLLPLPVSFRSTDIGHEFVEYATSLISLFQDGFVITSPRKLRLGSLLSIRIRMPAETPEGDFWYRRFAGRVVAEHRVGGELGYTVEFEPPSLPV